MKKLDKNEHFNHFKILIFYFFINLFFLSLNNLLSKLFSIK